MRFLVAIDGTDASDDALEYALTLAGRLDATLLLVYAVEPATRVADDGTTPETGHADAADTEFVRGALEDARTAGDRLLNDAAKRATVAGIDVDTRILDGDPLDVLPALADEVSVDGIVVGHRTGAHSPAGALNSVAKGLVDRSTVPVTVVP